MRERDVNRGSGQEVYIPRQKEGKEGGGKEEEKERKVRGGK